MATFQIENLPDELYDCIQDLAVANQSTLNETIIHLLRQAFQAKVGSPRASTTEHHQVNLMSDVLQRIRSRPRVNPTDYGLLDSTLLIQEDRDR